MNYSVRVLSSALFDPALQRMRGKEFKRSFIAACKGEENEWAKHIRYETRPSADEWHAIRGRVFERDNYTCQMCGSDQEWLECDHIKPVALGGSHEMDNLQTLCRSCNRKKGAR
jgi:5-methylcytosine-specific restriction endonuclease McrA